MTPEKSSRRTKTRPPGPRRLGPIRASLAARLALVFGLVSLIVVLIMGLAIYYLTARYLNSQAQQDMDTLADFYAAYTTSIAPDETSLVAMAPQITDFFAPRSDYDVRLFNARNGVLLATTQDLGELPSGVALAQLRRRWTTFLVLGSYDQPHRLYAGRSVLAADGTVLGVVEVSRDVSDTQALLSTLRLVLVATGGLALGAALVASLLFARQMTRPLRDIESATRSIAGGDFSRRLEVTSGDEIGRLAASINHMAADLARLEGARREFIAKVSHDLRTPLTAIKGLVVNLQDVAPEETQPALATVDEQTDRLVRLVNDLLTLSRLQRGELCLHLAEVDLIEVARSATSLVAEKARRLGISLDLDLPDSLPPISGDTDRLQQVMINLLDNALKETPAGGTVHVRAAGSGSEASVTIADTGSGLTEEVSARAFEPYFSGTGGTGLGLTIAREIIAAHGGRIWLKCHVNGGAEAGFALPLE